MTNQTRIHLIVDFTKKSLAVLLINSLVFVSIPSVSFAEKIADPSRLQASVPVSQTAQPVSESEKPFLPRGMDYLDFLSYEKSLNVLPSTLNGEDGTAPVIDLDSIRSNVTISNRVTIKWETNEASTTEVEYGLTEGLGQTTGVEESGVTSHAVRLDNLKSKTVYYYRVKSKDAAGNVRVSPILRFATRGASTDVTAPEITASDLTKTGDTEVLIQAETNEAATIEIEYGTSAAYGKTTAGGPQPQSAGSQPVYQTSHSALLTNLTPNATYHYRIITKDSVGNVKVGEDQTFQSGLAPIIYDVQVTNITDDGFTISWKTDKPTYGVVALGEKSKRYPLQVGHNDWRTDHVAVVTGLKAGTVYYYIIGVNDEYMRNTRFPEKTLKTLASIPVKAGGITVSQLDSDYTRDGYQVYAGSRFTQITYSSKITATGPVSWTWSYRRDGGPENTYSNGNGNQARAEIDYKNFTPGNYEWILRATSGGVTSTETFTTEVVEGTWAQALVPTIILDLDGDYTDYGELWGGVDRDIRIPAYDTDGDASSFSWEEIKQAGEILFHVAEKYSPFNIGVTLFEMFVPQREYADESEESAARYLFYEANKILKCVVGEDTFLNLPGEFLHSGVAQTEQIGYAFSKVDASYLGTGAASAAAHEIGHMLGLNHQSLYDANGNFLEEYYTGTDAPKWGVIMGSGGGGDLMSRGTWWNGEGNQPLYVDEVGVIASQENGFGYRPDDHGNMNETASAFSTASGSKLSVTGVIESLTDTDLFQFTLTQSGIVNFRLDPAEYGWMLDAVLEIRDSEGRLVTSQDAEIKGETLTTTLNSGTYYLAVKSHGRYGDLGSYRITGAVPYGTTSSAGPNPLGGAQNILEPVLGVPRVFAP